MKDNGADETVAPLKPGKRKATYGDRVLTGVGLLLAGASAFFPWYVFFNQDKFGIHVADMDRTRDLPAWPARNVFSVSPLAMVNKNDAPPPENLPDPLTTATVPDISANDLKEQPAETQPFPGKTSFKLLHVANGRALIEDDKGMYMVRIGSILPDNSRLASLEQREGKWVMITSTGTVYSNE